MILRLSSEDQIKPDRNEQNYVEQANVIIANKQTHIATPLHSVVFRRCDNIMRARTIAGPGYIL